MRSTKKMILITVGLGFMVPFFCDTEKTVTIETAPYISSAVNKMTKISEVKIDRCKSYMGNMNEDFDNVRKSVAITTNASNDTIAPTYVSINGTMNDITLPTAVFEDKGGSGLKNVKYYLSTKKTTPAFNSTGWKDLSSISYSPTCGQTYYLYAMATDNAGNYNVRSCPISIYTKTCNGSSTSGGVKSSGSAKGSSSGSSCNWNCQMQKNAEAWHSCTTSSCRGALEKANKDLADKNCSGCTRQKDGTWVNSSGSNVTWKNTTPPQSNTKATYNYSNKNSGGTSNGSKSTPNKSTGKTTTGSNAASTVARTIGAVIRSAFGLGRR